MDKKSTSPWWSAEGWDPGPTALWAVPWMSGSVSIFGAPDQGSARRLASDRSEAGADGWPDLPAFVPEGFLPVAALQLFLWHRDWGNAPAGGRARILDDSLEWSASAARDVRSCRPLGDRFSGDTLRKAWDPVPTSIWGRTTALNGLVVFTGDSSVQGAEPVEQIELHLSLVNGVYLPTTYRLWVFGHEVGWPRRAAAQGREYTSVSG